MTRWRKCLALEFYIRETLLFSCNLSSPFEYVIHRVELSCAVVCAIVLVVIYLQMELQHAIKKILDPPVPPLPKIAEEYISN